MGVIHSLIAGVMRSAVRDRRNVANSCEGTRLPEIVRAKVVPLETETVFGLRDAMPDEVKDVITFAAGTGLRLESASD